MISDEDKYIANQYIVMIIENLIREMELQGRDFVTTTELRKFLHNMETNTKVVGKVYRGKIDV